MASLTNEIESQEDTHHCTVRDLKGRAGIVFTSDLDAPPRFLTDRVEEKNSCRTQLKNKKRLSAAVHSRLFSVTRWRSRLQK